MGVITRNRPSERIRKLAYVWSWRARYWFLDTEAGQKTRIGTLVVSLLVCIADALWILHLATLPRPAGAPVTAVFVIDDIIYYVIILIIAALIAYAMRPKPENAKPQESKSPTTVDGTPVKDYFGTCWIDHDDTHLLAWRMTGRDPIRSKGGK